MGELREKTEIAEELCAVFGLSVSDLSKNGGTRHLYETRRAVILFLHDNLGVSLNAIADVFGKSNRNICYIVAKGREEMNDASKSSFKHKYGKMAEASHRFY